MISKILNLSQISQISQISQDAKYYNNTLPILLQVLEKTRMGYLLKLGNNIIEAKSTNNLQIGAKFWAIVKDSSVGEILISNLIKQPKIFENIQFSTLKYTIKEFETMVKDGKFVQKFREDLIDNFLKVNSKDEFLFLTNSLLALNKRILNIVIKDNNKNILMQIKRPKGSKIEFSAIFNNLGMIEGSIYNSQKLILKVQYQNVKNILQNNLKYLEGFSEISILVDEDSEIFFNVFDENILDIKA